MPDRTPFLAKMQQIMDESFSVNVQLHLVGSSVTTLGLPSSDIDLCGIVDDSQPIKFDFSPRNMRFMGKMLRNRGFRKVVPIAHARVPICKFYDHEFRVWCDYNATNRLGVLNSRLLRAYVDTSVYVRPLILLAKFWANKRGLNDSSLGGTK